MRRTLNRTERGAAATVQYAVTPLTTIAALGDVTEHRFEFAPERDGERVQVGGAVAFTPEALISGRASLSWQRVTVATAAVAPFSGPVGTVDLSTRIGAATRVGAGGGRDVVFSSDDLSPYYVQNSLRASITQGLGSRWDVGVRRERASLDYVPAANPVPAPRDQERVSSIRGGLGYHFAGGLRIGIDVEAVQRTSTSDAHRSYTTNRIVTSLSKPLGF